MIEAHQKIEALIQIAGEGWLQFQSPEQVLQTRDPTKVASVLSEVDARTRTKDGCHAVGFVTYEAAQAFGLTVHPGSAPVDLPLVWFGLFGESNVRRVPALSADRQPYDLGPLVPSVDRKAFDLAFARIKQRLADGDTYQVNYTFRLQGAFTGHAPSLFADLALAQGCRYGAYIAVGAHSICSASPELFLARVGTSLSSRPMKGTAARGRTPSEDAHQRDELRLSPKQRAENVMIVDMVRNDLGRIADVGSVEVPELFSVERFPNVWQMTSLVTARSSASLMEVFAAVHPSASVTGAPKVRTMKLLAELEGRPRGLYTGAIGYVAPGGDGHFNVAIRTAVVDHRSMTVHFGIGSGIVWDSVSADEYDECLLKGSVLGRRAVEFELLETLRWTPGAGFFLLERHLKRMRESAEYFDFAYNESGILEALASVVKSREAPHERTAGALRIRVLLSRSGSVRVESRPLEPSRVPLVVRIAEEPVDVKDPFLFHKTTNRGVYERARAGRCEDEDEVILWNSAGEVTEATTANVVVELEESQKVAGPRVTPPIACGLLGGTFRAELLASGEVRESVVTLDQLRRARRLWLINSVHEWREARLGASRAIAIDSSIDSSIDS
jgi:para-aminobenzoate synthetase/4-amino-4-deoxychorismate lyase